MEFKEKFIAFVDILGFKDLTVKAESEELSFELAELGKDLGSADDRNLIRQNGPTICPDSARIQANLDFELTQISDCVIVSTEISPAGVVSLINHCCTAVLRLLNRGIMCRGYITRGKIDHTEGRLFGTGYIRAYEGEKGVSVFKRTAADDRGTPFVEIDPAVSEYVKTSADSCVKEMSSRMVQLDGQIYGLFPFQRLQHSFAIGWQDGFDVLREKRSNQNTRKYIQTLKEKIDQFVDKTNPRAVTKAEHYLKALDAQLANCDWTDGLINMLGSSIRSTKEIEPERVVDLERISKINELPSWPPTDWESKDRKPLDPETAATAVLSNVIIHVTISNCVTLEIEHEKKAYSTDLIVPKELKDRVGYTLVFSMQEKTIADLGELEIIGPPGSWFRQDKK